MEDGSLESKILHAVFPVSSLAVGSQLPHPEDIPENSSLLSCVSPSGLPQAALVTLLWRLLQPLLLRLQVSASRPLPQGSLPQAGAWVSPSQPCAYFNHWNNSLDSSVRHPRADDTCLTVSTSQLRPSSCQGLKQAGEAPWVPRFSSCLLPLVSFCPFFATCPSPDHPAYKNSSRKNCSDSHQDGVATGIQEKAQKPRQPPVGSFPAIRGKMPPKGQISKNTWPPLLLTLSP